MLLGVIFQPVPHQPEQAALPAISLTQHTLDCDDAVFPLNQGLLDCHRLVHAELSNPGVGQVGTSHSVLELLRGAVGMKKGAFVEGKERAWSSLFSFWPSPSFLQWVSQRFQKMGFYPFAPCSVSPQMFPVEFSMLSGLLASGYSSDALFREQLWSIWLFSGKGWWCVQIGVGRQPSPQSQLGGSYSGEITQPRCSFLGACGCPVAPCPSPHPTGPVASAAG